MTTPVQTMTSSMNYFDSDWNNLEEFAKWKSILEMYRKTALTFIFAITFLCNPRQSHRCY